VVTLAPASIVIMPFPFSDLSGTKLRPAVILANAGHSDWLLCQITSNPYSDPDAIRLTHAELKRGTLNIMSFARPIKLFTADESLIVKRVAILHDKAFKALLTATIELLKRNLPK
jgi:mRNA interferase MazF